MRPTELFVRNPVLSLVLTILIVVLGVRAAIGLPVVQYPQTESAVITITTVYYGASAETVAGFITTPIENAVAQAEGIDTMTSISQTSASVVTLNLRLNYSTQRALVEISTKINSIINQLPSGTLQPSISVAGSSAVDAMYLGFETTVLQSNEMTDYLVRIVQPRLQSITGVQTAELLGGRNFAIRVWMDPIKLAAFNMTAADITGALLQNNYISGVGSTKGQMVQVTLTADTDLHSLDQFRRLVVRQTNNATVRLEDVAQVVLGASDYENQVWLNGKKSVYIGIKTAPSANLLNVIKGVKAAFPTIQAEMPKGLTANIIYDSGTFVQVSLDELVKTLVESIAIVTLVVFVFLGSPRSVIIPVLAIPASLIGTFTVMAAFGFSINLLTLLALVLAIGLVVDDVIIVVENVNRHTEDGLSPLDAAIKAARELSGPIVAMTIVLIAVYVPIGLQGGLTGALFTEFAFTLAAAVTLSGVVALTLSPMMCARLLRAKSSTPTWDDRLTAFIFHRFARIQAGYERRLRNSLNFRPVTYVFAALVIGGIYFLYTTATSELAPQEDQGIVLTTSLPAPSATLQQRELYTLQHYDLVKALPELDQIFQIDVPGTSINGLVMKPWDLRTRTTNQLQPVIQNKVATIAGERVVAFQPPTLPGSSGLPVQFALTTTRSFHELEPVANGLLQKAQASGLFAYVDSDLKIDQPQSQLHIDPDKTALLGLRLSDVGSSLASMLSGGYVNYFSMAGRAYQVIPQVQQASRLNPSQVLDYYIRTGSGVAVPVSTVASIQQQTVPEALHHFQQLNSATISGVPAPGVSVGDALKFLQDIAATDLPQGFGVDYGGQSRQFVAESSGFAQLFGFAIVLIFLALSAQFNSFRDPLIILVSVPLSIGGALMFLNLGVGGLTLNIYTEVGLVTLIGLISKHGILIVEFANGQQRLGMSKLDAAVSAAGTRLRPILMTTAAMVLGLLPLVFASGAGAVSRFNIGLVITTGIAIGTVCTLFVVPAFYVLLAERLQPLAPVKS